MTSVEKRAQNYWQGPCFIEETTSFKLLPKPFLPSLISHYKIQEQLLHIWLAHAENLQKSYYAATALNFTEFSSDRALLDNILQKDSGMFLSEKKKLMEFYSFLRRECLESIKGKNIDAIEGVYLIAKQQIAQLIFLADQNILATAHLIDIENVKESLANVNNAFDYYLQKSLRILVDQVELHDRVPLQNSAMVAARKKATAITQMLLTSTGHLNLGLVDLIKQKFFNEKLPLIHYEKEMRHTLDMLARSSEMQEQFYTTVKPCSPFLPSNDWIRVTLNLAPDAILNEFHAKFTVLEALLSDLCQGDVGNCLDKCVGVMALGPLKQQVLRDLKSLVSYGRLIRPDDRSQVLFNPLLPLSENSLQASVTIESSGKMISGAGYLWEAPGLLKACDQLGVNSAQEAIQQVIHKMYAEHSLDLHELLEISPEILLKQLIKIQTGQLQKQQRRDVKHRVFLAFNNETHCSLLRAWESNLSAHAQSESTNRIRNKILKCSAAALDPLWPKSLFSRAKKGHIEKAKKVFGNVLNNAIGLHFDPYGFVQPAQFKNNQARVLGTIALYEVKQGVTSCVAKLIETPEQFKTFVLKQLQKTKKILEKASNKTEANDLKTFDKMFTFLAKENTYASSFIKAAIKNYDLENRGISDPLTMWERLEFLPFREVIRENERPELYTRSIGNLPGQPHTVCPKNAKEFLQSFVAFNRHEVKTKETQNFRTFKLKDLPLEALETLQTVDEWIETAVVKPGESIASIPLTSELKQRFQQAVCTHILKEELIPGFQRELQKISENDQTVSSYGKKILNALLKMVKQPTASLENTIFQELTHLMLQKVLSSEAVKILTSSAVKIAQISFPDEKISDVSLICFYNPLGQSLNLALLEEKTQHLFLLKPEEWMMYIPHLSGFYTEIS